MDDTPPSGGASNGQTSTSKGGPHKILRRQKTADPLRPRKKPVERRRHIQAKPNITGALDRTSSHRGTPGPASNANPNLQRPQFNVPRPPVANGGSSQPGDQFFPLVTTKKELRESMRFHLARFTSNKNIDPADSNQFTRPIRLARRAPQDQRQRSKEENVSMEDVPDSKERERLEILKAQKEARRAADQAQIAPVGNNASALAARKARSDKGEKTSQSRRKDKNQEQQKESALRYEEAFSWYLEDDAEPPNGWMGIYEAALSEVNVIFYTDGPVFRMVPIEKWYKFIPKGLSKTMTTEEAEIAMTKKAKETRWAMRDDQVKQEKNINEHLFRHGFGMSFAVKGESSTALRATKTEGRDMDDLDFDADDLFQDDDETMNFHPEKDEEAEAAKDRVKRDQLGAGVFDLRDEREVDKEAEREERQKVARKKDVKGKKKHLKRDKTMIDVSSDEDDDPLKSDSDSTDSEQQRRDAKKKEEEKAKAWQDQKAPSITPTGSNTPSGRPKHTDVSTKPTSLKRAASPNPSESSGNESARKKIKKSKTSNTSAGLSTTMPPAPRQLPQASSNTNSQTSVRKTSVIKLPLSSSKLSKIDSAPPNPSPGLSTSMSDGEGTGGEMSDGAGGKIRKKKNKIKLKLGKNGGSSPTDSRAGSPSAVGSRAGSPVGVANTPPLPATAAVAATSAPRAQSPRPPLTVGKQGPIQRQEIIDAVPEGAKVDIKHLIKSFPNRIGNGEGQMSSGDFRKLFASVLRYDPATKLLSRK